MYYDQGTFQWNGERWVHPFFLEAYLSGTFFAFNTPFDLADSGLRTSGSAEHRVLVGNPHLKYVLQRRVALGPGRVSDRRGGYGILFDTTLADNVDSGYIFQFDRGFGNGELVIRERVNGSEQQPLLRHALPDQPAEWWVEERELELRVTRLPGADNRKQLEVIIDGVFMFDWEFGSDIDPAYNHTGFRIWHESDGTVFPDLTNIGL